MGGELKAKESFREINVKEIETVKVREVIRDVVVPKFVEKVVEKPVFKEVQVLKPVLKEETVVVEKVRVEDVTKVVTEAAISAIKEWLNSLQIVLEGEGNLRFRVKK